MLLGLLSLVVAFGHSAWSGADRGKATSSVIAGTVTAVTEREYLIVRTDEEREQAVMITEETRFVDARGKATRAAAIVVGSSVRIRTSESHGKWLALEVSLTDGSAAP